MDVSFLVPVYNAGEYIEDCIKSIYSQFFEGIECEIICCDDCSKDDSYNKLKALSQKFDKLKIYKNDVNEGVSSTRNKLVSLAKGEFIWFVDADDILYKGVLQYMYKLAKERNSDAVVGEISTVNDSYDFEKYDFKNQEQKFKIAQKRGDFHVYSGSNVVRGIYRREIIVANSITFNPNIKYGEDTLWAFKFGNYAEEILEVPFLTYIYRQISNSAMHNVSLKANINRYESFYYFYHDLIDFSKKNIKDKEACELKISNVRQNAIQCLAMVQDKKYIKEQFKKLKKEGFYPYPFRKEALYSNEPKWKRWLLYLLPLKLFFWVLHKLYMIQNKKS